MKQKARRLFYRLGGPIFVVFFLWEVFSRLGLFDALILPPPTLIFQRAIRAVGNPFIGEWGVLEQNLFKSATRAAMGFSVAAVLASLTGVAMGVSRWIRRALEPIAGILIPIPMMAWTPIFLMVFGRGDTTVISVVFMAAFFPILYNVASGVQTVSKHHQWALEALGAGWIDLLLKCWLPGALPYVMTGLRLGMGFSWRALVAAEMLGADQGLGAMIFSARTFMDTRLMYVGIVLLGLSGYFFEHVLFGQLERRTVQRWGLLSA